MSAHLKYAKYLFRHKWFVFVAGLKTQAPLWRLIIHDWSKFLPCEWFPYARYFYGNRKWYEWVDATGKYLPGFSGRGLQQLKGEFDLAWLHHQHANPHHWQHWILREDSGAVKLLDIPEHFIREMVADWMGAGRAITGKWDVAIWYAKNEEIIRLNPYVRGRVEYWISVAGPQTQEEK